MSAIRSAASSTLGPQLALLVAAWAYVLALHWGNDGLWYPDASRHATNGLFWGDFLATIPVSPLEYAVSYYARYPVINPTGWPPAFYLIEALAYRLLGPSALVAKMLVAAFLLVAGVYLLAWLRRWSGVLAGWGAPLIVLQPGTIVWMHAVMLNLPSMAVAVAALYHWRRWLEERSVRQFYLALGCAALAALIYLPTAVVFLVMVVWAALERRIGPLLAPRNLIAGVLTCAPVAVWGVIATRWAPGQRAIGLHMGDYPFWMPRAWTFYLEHISSLVTPPVLVAALVAVALAVVGGGRRELRFLGSWFVVSHLWFSAISVKEPRYALLLIPPLVGLAVAAVVAIVERISPTAPQRVRRGLVAALVAMVLVHGVTARAVAVPNVNGFREIVAFLQTTVPPQRVFYDGVNNGVFSFYLRAADDAFRWSVVLGSKLLYATRIEVRFGTLEFAESEADVITLLQRHCGCRFVLVERQIDSYMAPVAAIAALRNAVRGDQFRLVRSFRVEAPRGVTDVDLYENIGMVASPDVVDLPFPTLGDAVRFRVTPVEPRK